MSVQVVITTTATIHIAVYVAAIHLDVCLTRTIDTLQLIISATGLLLHVTTSDGSNLTTTEYAVTYVSAIDGHIRLVDGTVVDISTTKQTARIRQQRVRSLLGVVFYLLLIVLVKVLGRCVIATC